MPGLPRLLQRTPEIGSRVETELDKGPAVIRSRLASAISLPVVLAAASWAHADTPSATAGGSAIETQPDEVSYFGERVYSLRQWPPSSAWGIAFRKYYTPYFAASFAYLNDGHFPGHHRDGVAAEGWVPLGSFYDHFTVSFGAGAFYYYDTVFAQTAGGYADAHGWAWIGSVEMTYQAPSWRHFFLEARIDYTTPAKSIETTSVGAGFGYRGLSDFQGTSESLSPEPNELVASYWKTVVNSFSSQTARAEAFDYRRQLYQALGFSVGFVNEGDAQLIRRNGITAEAWLEPTFGSGRWSIGGGFGVYSAIDKYRPSPGRHASVIVSATMSYRVIDHLDIRFLWHRIATDYNRDTDIVLWGVGYRF